MPKPAKPPLVVGRRSLAKSKTKSPGESRGFLLAPIRRWLLVVGQKQERAVGDLCPTHFFFGPESLVRRLL